MHLSLFSYINPDQMIPMATPIAMAIGFFLMFGRYVLAKITGMFKAMFGIVDRAGEGVLDEAEPQILPFPGVFHGSHENESQQAGRRAA